MQVALALAIAVSAIAGSAAFTASAGAAVQLNWEQQKVWAAVATDPITNRTWLGAVTRPGSGQGWPDGKASASNGLLGPSLVEVTSPDDFYTWSYPAESGSFNATTLSGEMRFGGTLAYTSIPHGYNITFEDPRIVLNGDGTGEFYSSGTNGLTPAGPYDESQPVFDLDLSQSTCTLNWDGTLTLGNIIPTLHATGYPFPNNYLAGAGPDRTPNTFGYFSISGATCAPLSGPQGPAGSDGADGSNGAQGPQGPTGPQGPAGKDASIKTIVFKRAPFGKRARLVASIQRGTKTVGYAKVIGRKVRATYITESLKGTYTLKEIGGKKRSKRVKLG